MKLNKNIKIFINYFLGPVLFLWLAWSIYNQIRGQQGLDEAMAQIKISFNSTKVFYLIAAILLMLVNWGIESYKWMLAVKRVQTITFGRAFKAVFSGISFSISTPNRVGEYLGRVLYMSEGNRIKAIALTIVASVSQLIITIIMGLAAMFFLKEKLIAGHILSPVWLYAILYGTGIGLAVLLLFYFRLSWFVKIIDKLPGLSKFSWAIEALEYINATLLFRFLSLSTTRFLVFSLQYYLLFRFFGVDVSMLQSWMGISVMFLVMAVVPTIALFTDLGLKNELSLKLIGLFSSNHLGISLTSLSIWLINLVIPGLVGSLLILGIRNIIKNKNEI